MEAITGPHFYAYSDLTGASAGRLEPPLMRIVERLLCEPANFCSGPGACLSPPLTARLLAARNGMVTCHRPG